MSCLVLDVLKTQELDHKNHITNGKGFEVTSCSVEFYHMLFSIFFPPMDVFLLPMGQNPPLRPQESIVHIWYTFRHELKTLGFRVVRCLHLEPRRPKKFLWDSGSGGFHKRLRRFEDVW